MQVLIYTQKIKGITERYLRMNQEMLTMGEWLLISDYINNVLEFLNIRLESNKDEDVKLEILENIVNDMSMVYENNNFLNKSEKLVIQEFKKYFNQKISDTNGLE